VKHHATMWNNGELQLFSHQRFNYCFAKNTYLDCWRPHTIFVFLVILFMIEEYQEGCE